MNCMSKKTDELFQVIRLGGISLFGALTESQLEVVWRYLDVQKYLPGQRVFQQGELPSAIYIVASGKIDFIVQHGDVLKVEASYTDGQTFGESAYLGIQPHAGSAQVRSAGPAEVMVLTREALIDMQREDESLFALLMMNLAREVSRKYQGILSAS